MRHLRSKIGATIEALVVFSLVVVLFQSVRVSPFSRWEEATLPGSRLFILEYGVVLGFVLGLMALTRRDWGAYGMTLRVRRRQVRVIAIGLLPVMTLGGVLGMVNWSTWTGAGIVSAVAVGMLIIMGWALNDAGTGQACVMILALSALAPAITNVGAAGTALLKTLYVYLLVGPAEEALFRGYIQSRLNEAWGRPYRFFGVRWGWGLVIASMLFGLWHVVWRPLAGGAWPHGMWSFFVGLLFGYVRERSDSIVPASVLHSVMNYLPL
jgi:hypothetical protein